MKRKIILLLAISFSCIDAMDLEKQGVLFDNPTLIRLASSVKNKIYELKAELNYTDTTGFLSLMHLSVLDPSRNQTKQGIFLESIDGVPSAIHVPFGRWQFAALNVAYKDHSKKLMNMIIQEFDLELYKIKFHDQRQFKNRIDTRNNSVVSVYAIRRIGQNQLEKGVYKEETEYMNAMHAKAAWEAIFTE